MDSQFTMLLTDSRAYLAQFDRQGREWCRVALHTIELSVPFLPQSAEDLRGLGQELARQVSKLYPDGCSCQLIILSSWCLAHAVKLPTSRWSDQTAEFEFEQYIPVELETLTCVSQRNAAARGLVLGVFTDSILAFLAALEEQQVLVETVTVDAVAAPGLPGQDDAPRPCGFIFLDEHRMSLGTLDETSALLTNIRTVGISPTAETEDLRRQVTASVATLDGSCTRWSVHPLSTNARVDEIVGVLEGLGCSVEVNRLEDTVDGLLEATIKGESLPDLRRGSLAFPGRWAPIRDRCTRLAVSVVVVLLVLGTMLHIEGTRYAQATDDLRPLQQQVYHQAFPESLMPHGAALRIRSERIKLEGLTGTSTDDSHGLVPSGLAAFELLHRVTERVPDDLKLNINEILLDDRGIRISGQTTSHSDAGRIVSELNQLSDLIVDPPRTKLRKDKTVDFRIRASRKRASDDQ